MAADSNSTEMGAEHVHRELGKQKQQIDARDGKYDLSG
jgi:hypothetical protein